MERQGQRRLRERTDIQAAVLGAVSAGLTAAAALFLCAALTAERAWPWVILAAAAVAAFSALWARRRFRRLSNPSYCDLASTDYLTQLKNRNAFEVDLENLSDAECEKMGLILMDLDNLKEVNDTLGHTAGDQYLRSAADAMRKAACKRAVAYRVGGDEFVLLVRQTGEKELEELSEEIAAQFAQGRPPWNLTLSLSVGWAAFDGNLDAGFWGTYCRADQRMYANKQGRRGR